MRYELSDYEWTAINPMLRTSRAAFLYDRGCVPSNTVAMIEFDEPPWDRILDKP
jgi:hypothetical protein